MAITWRADEDITVIVVDDGPTPPQEFSEAGAAMFAEGLWHPDRPVLLDLRSMNPAEASRYPQMRQRVAEWSQLGSSPPKRIALLALPGAIYGIARMVQTLAGGDAEVFEDEQDARTWLLSSGDGGG
jgi:hypothetical protein